MTDQLRKLITEYSFNVETLSKYLEIPVSQVRQLSQGKMDFLPEDDRYRYRLFDKIQFLYFTAIDDSDLKLRAFLKVLISRHKLTKKTIAKMADVEISDVEKILSYPPHKVSEDIKYRVAVTAMSLRFFLKECEAKQ